MTRGLPSVRVPVLSVTRVSTFPAVSMATAFFTSIPDCAALPTPTMIDIGVASPSAQGQAMMSTDTALTIAKAIAGVGPKVPQTTKVITEMSKTMGTK